MCLNNHQYIFPYFCQKEKESSPLKLAQENGRSFLALSDMLDVNSLHKKPDVILPFSYVLLDIQLPLHQEQCRRLARPIARFQ